MTHIYIWTGSQFIPCNFGAKPLPEPMMTYCLSGPKNKLQWFFKSKLEHFHSRKYIWRCRPQNGGHVVESCVCQLITFLTHIYPWISRYDPDHWILSTVTSQLVQSGFDQMYRQCNNDFCLYSSACQIFWLQSQIWHLTLTMLKIVLGNIKRYVFIFSHFSALLWHKWLYISPWKTMVPFPSVYNTMAVDGLATQGARASAKMVLTSLSWDNSISAPKGLTQLPSYTRRAFVIFVTLVGDFRHCLFRDYRHFYWFSLYFVRLLLFFVNQWWSCFLTHIQW